MVNCRNCMSILERVLIDLGSSPISNAYVSASSIAQAETWYPLKVLACSSCGLAQTQDYLTSEELFIPDYAYFSSASTSWLQHARDFVDSSVDRLGLEEGISLVVEVGANDGYLLRHFQELGVPCVGIEPTHAAAEAARALGLTILEEFLGSRTGKEIADTYGKADLVVANNVFAHVPDLGDFIEGLRSLIKPRGVISIEFPTLASLVTQCQFDTIYHEHYSYFSLASASDALTRRGLEIFDVEVLPTHGGSLRLFVQDAVTKPHAVSPSVENVRVTEVSAGVAPGDTFEGFQEAALGVKIDLLQFLIDCKREGASVVAYGAAAKGNTLLNFAGVRQDMIEFVVDRSPMKVGKHLPGSRIPILAEAALTTFRPDYILILPWNLKEELSVQLEYARQWGAKFVIAIPKLTIW